MEEGEKGARASHIITSFIKITKNTQKTCPPRAAGLRCRCGRGGVKDPTHRGDQ